MAKVVCECDKLTKDRKKVMYSTQDIEELLCREEYATVPASARYNLTKEEHEKVNVYESVTSFGADIADLFEDLMEDLGRIPTQAEFIKKGVFLTKEWWAAQTLRRNYQIYGVSWDKTIEQACKDRLGRSYLSIVNELHTTYLLKELFPAAKIITDDLLDLVMGVDIVMEYKSKRLYFHVYKNSYWGKKAFISKEKRGGMKNQEGTYIKYRRNFRGDISLMYDTFNSDTTRIVNGIPLFTEDYIIWVVEKALRSGVKGEPITKSASKLHKLSSWLLNNFGVSTNF